MSGNGHPHPTRRHIITSAAAAAALLGFQPLARAQTSAARLADAIPLPSRSPLQRLRFFSAREFAILDEFAEMLISEDAKSGGARTARVAWILDQRIAESRDPDWRQSWHDDLAEIDRLSQLWFGRRFVDALPEQRIELMRRISKNEKNPREAGEYAFGTIKWSVADIYYRTRIGIHDELEYKGNVLQDEFSGTDVARRG